MIHSEIMSVTMTRGDCWGPYVMLGAKDRPSIDANVSRSRWGSIELDDKARVWFLFDFHVWVQWLPKETNLQPRVKP